MSSVVPDLNNANTAGQPQHRIHTADEPLPGARGAAPPPQSYAVERLGAGASQHDQHSADHHRQDVQATPQNTVENGTGALQHNQLFADQHRQNGKAGQQNAVESGIGAPQHDKHFANQHRQDASAVPQRTGEHTTGAPHHNQHFTDHHRQNATSHPQNDPGHTHPNNFGTGNTDSHHYPPAKTGGDVHPGLGHVPHHPDRNQHHTGAAAAAGTNAFNSERPLGVRPTEAGGVAVGGNPNKPLGSANLVDKVVGKTEKVVGKAINDPEMHERGELREIGGKSAVTGGARAAHD